MTKKELRAAMRRKNLGITPSERAAASGRIFARAELSEAFGRARTVGVFCSLPDEPDTAETLARWSAVKRIVVPRVEGDVMRFCEYDPQTLRPGAFGIAEPGPEAQTCDPSEIDLVIVHTDIENTFCCLHRNRSFFISPIFFRPPRRLQPARE